MNFEKFYGIFMMVLGFASIIFSLIASVAVESEIELVDCFDRYGNKIIGEVCETDRVDDLTMGIGLLGFVIFIFGAVVFFVYLVNRGWS